MTRQEQAVADALRLGLQVSVAQQLHAYLAPSVSYVVYFDEEYRVCENPEQAAQAFLTLCRKYQDALNLAETDPLLT